MGVHGSCRPHAKDTLWKWFLVVLRFQDQKIGIEVGAMFWGIIWAEWLIGPLQLESDLEENSNDMHKSRNGLVGQKLWPAEVQCVKTLSKEQSYISQAHKLEV